MKRRQRKRRKAEATGGLAECAVDVQTCHDAVVTLSNVKRKSNDAAAEEEDEVGAALVHSPATVKQNWYPQFQLAIA